MDITVVIPTHNPRRDYLQQVITALRQQTLPPARWALVLVDNHSSCHVEEGLDLSWQPNAKIVREPILGLTAARLCGFRSAKSDLIVLVDDDNVLGRNFLEETLVVASEYPMLGVWGGAIRPHYEAPNLAPPTSLLPLLTVRTPTSDSWSNDINHHVSTPWGAGLCVRRTVAERYAAELESKPQRRTLDLQGSQLRYGGDTDIVYTACRMGLGKGVFPRLELEHLIPASRCSADYLCRVAEGRGYTEVLHEIILHGTPTHPSSSFDAWLRARRRRWHLSALEQKVDVAHERGRRKAIVELVAAS
jgi:glycosyltransferase involved in cell wall biosynthesis